MSKTIFPQTTNKNWIQKNKGDLFPVLFSTRNINMEKRGYIGLSRRMSYIKKNTGLNGLPTAIKQNANASRYKAITGTSVFNVNYDFSTIGQDTDIGAVIGVDSDMAIYNSKIWFSPTSVNVNLYYRAAGASSGAYSTLSLSLNTVTHPMEVFVNKNLLCVGDGNVVKTVNSSNSVNLTALTLPTEYTIVNMIYLNNKMYIGTVNQAGGHAMLFEWDGANSASSNGYEVNARSILSLSIYQESVIVLTSKGEGLRFGGGGFTQIFTLPFFQNKDYSWFFDNTEYSYQSARQCMYVDDEYLYVDLQNSMIYNNSLSFVPEFVAGLYQYHKDFGLVNKFTPSQSTSSSITDYGQSFTESISSFTGLQEDSISYPNSPEIDTGIRFLVGAKLINSSLTKDIYLQSITSGESRGDFVTSKIYTGDITNVNKKLFIKYKNLIDTTDKIVVKYRSSEKNYLPIKLTADNTNAVTWTSTTTFTSDNANMQYAEIGDEVFVLTGNGAGCLAHIDDISENAGTYTVTLDEAVTGVSNGNRSAISIDNWSKLDTIDYTNTDGFQEIPIGINGKWFQLKVEFRGANEPSIEEITLLSEPEIVAE